jgi:hypothetical protein
MTNIAKVKDSYGYVHSVIVRLMRHRAIPAWSFTAPGWRPMACKSEDAAKRKIESHKGFMGWL